MPEIDLVNKEANGCKKDKSTWMQTVTELINLVIQVEHYGEGSSSENANMGSQSKVLFVNSCRFFRCKLN